MKKFVSKIYSYILNPPSDEALAKAWQQSDKKLPIIWLLGKTGSGKSSIVQVLTGHTRAEIGNGYMPCTKNTGYFEYPQEHPILRFLDTRGLGEVDYDANADIHELGNSSHALLVVMRLRDGEQSAVLTALKNIRASAKHIQQSSIAVVHTGALELDSDHDRNRALRVQQLAVEKAWGTNIDHCSIDFSKDENDESLQNYGIDRLKEMISKKIPELSLWLHDSDHDSAEQRNFEKLSTEVLWYAGTAAVTDAIPLVGLVSVPAIQGKMLHSLAQKYSLVWSVQNYSEFIAALGSGFALRYAVSLGARQLGKLIPGYGQLVGTAFAVTISYASTYAIGRAACSYLYHKKTNTPIDQNALHTVYKEALTEGKQAGRDIAQEKKE